MIGGTVTKVKHLSDRTWIKCEDDHYTDTCAIYVKRSDKSEKIKPGDCVWWQGNWAMHTPYENRFRKNCGHKEHITCLSKCGVDYDIRLERIGYSGVKEPAT